MSSAVLEIENVSYRYEGRRPLRFPDCRLNAGEVTALVGPSGSGKSTLLLLIAGLLETHTGHIAIVGETLGRLSGAARDRRRGQIIGMVLQSFQLLPRLSVLENLTAARYLSGHPADIAAAREVLAGLGIAELQDERPSRLSRGQLQRAAIARAVVNRPKLLLADEPTSSLDDEAAAAALALLLRESERFGATLLIATHDSRVKAKIPHMIELRQNWSP